MKNTINFNDFCDAWVSYDRAGSFTYEGKRALFDWIEELEQDTGEEIELDIVGLDCQFSEYESLAEIQENYNDIETMQDLYDNTLVVEFDGGIIISEF